MEKKFKPKCKLIGENGNVLNLVAVVLRTLRKHKMREEAEELISRIVERGEAKSYDEALRIIMEYVEVV